ncbi:MAG: hypothetical protein IPG76_20445 [Acidobacteria bacterium]|nr:hypothetical protein [Acidobacteriota bacterium]
MNIFFQGGYSCPVSDLIDVFPSVSAGPVIIVIVTGRACSEGWELRAVTFGCTTKTALSFTRTPS